MASQLHPDLYRLHLTSEDHERLTRIYARVAEAYLVLRDPETRTDYTLSLADKAPVASTVGLESALPPKARRLYRRAQALLRTGDYASAILELRMAVASAPQSALLRDALNDALERKRGG